MAGTSRHINIYGGSPLNRLSWLRPSQSFLNTVIAVPDTRWILFNAGQPLMILTNDRSTKPSPIYLTTNDVKPFLGQAPYFGQGKESGDLVDEKKHTGEDTHMDHSPTESARHLGIPVVFLGVHEPQSSESGAALLTSDFSNPENAIKNLDGTPYFAMDVADMDYTAEQLQEILKETTPGREGKVLDWSEPRASMSNLDNFTAAIFASARIMVDWNLRNKYCAGCGARTYSMWGGWKISCSSLLPWADNSNRKPCLTTKGLHNFNYPRTDAVVIMIAIDETGDKVLLGRKRFPGNLYSALAGFIEPAETFEDAVAREMWEEAGVRVWNVKYHSDQPWPFPANLMVGFYARADSTKPIRTDLDNELTDARWFTRDEVRSVLEHREGTRFDKSDYKKMNEVIEARSNLEQKAGVDSAMRALTPAEFNTTPRQPHRDGELPFRLPPTTAIAGVLIRDWVDGKIGFPQDVNDVKMQRGHL